MGIIGSGIASALGSIIGGRSQAKAQEQANLQNIAMQREFAQQGIRWKVEDAKAAGLHPLFALGGSGATFTPSVQPVFNQGIGPALQSMGQGVSRAIAAQSTVDEVAERQARLKLIEAQTNESNARAASMLAASENARLGQAQVATFPLGYHASDLPVASRQLAEENRHWRMGLQDVIPGQGGSGSKIPTRGPVEDPRKVITPAVGDESRTAGREGAWNLVTMYPGDRWRHSVQALMPVNQEGWTEGLESMPKWKYPAWIAHNVRTFGVTWPIQMLTSLGSVRAGGRNVVDEALIAALRNWVGRTR